MTHPTRRLPLVAACAALVACDPMLVVRVEPDSRAGALVLRVFAHPDSATGTRRLRALTVALCDSAWSGPGRVVWAAEAGAGAAVPPARIAYGPAPAAGWRVTRGPEPLAAGCYLAGADGAGVGGSVRFAVERDGAVAVFPDGAWVPPAVRPPPSSRATAP